MFTFIYCFDENYNIQGFVSIMSLLDKVSEKINIVIVHKQKEKFSKYEKLINNHNNLENLDIKEINTKDIEFPNIDGTVMQAKITSPVFYDPDGEKQNV